MISSAENEVSGEWAPPTGSAHPDLSGTQVPDVLPHAAAISPAVEPDESAEGLDLWPPPPAWAPATVLLDDPQHRSGRSRSPIAIGALVVLALALLVGVLFLSDWAARNIEAVRLLHQIEKSEAAMGEVQAATVEVARSAPRGTFPLAPDKNLPREISSKFKEISVAGRGSVSDAGQEVAAVSFLPWHSDMITAQASYLDHNLAWVRHLEAGSEEGEVLVRGDDQDIESTWNAAEAALRAALPVVTFPGILERVDAIFEEAAEEVSGPTLDVIGPGGSISPFWA